MLKAHINSTPLHQIATRKLQNQHNLHTPPYRTTKKKSKTDSTASNSEEFSREYQSRFKFTPPPELPNAQTVITVAMPRPLTKAAFTWNGKTQSYTLPPIYTAHDKTKLYVEHTLAEELETRNYKTATAMLPLKLLAARSGLAE